MGKKKEEKDRKLYVADTETTVDDEEWIEIHGEQERTDVWLAVACPVIKRPEPDDVLVTNNIYEHIDWLSRREDGAIVFYHNLKFDGSFILDELNREGFVQAMSVKDSKHYASDWEMSLCPFSYKCLISNMGQWYSIKIRFDDRTIELRDSSKKIPTTIRKMGKDFNTKYRKLNMKYEGHRKPFGNVTKTEIDYAKNDVLVLAEAMYIIWYEYGMTGITIASDALKKYKEMITEPVFDQLFPDLQSMELPILMQYTDTDPFGNPVVRTRNMNVYDYCQKGYSGGWCYKNPVANNGKTFLSKEYIGVTLPFKYQVDEDDDNSIIESDKSFDEYTDEDDTIIVKNSIVCDVNSLYPSMMHSMSGNEYPVGLPKYHTGEPTDKQVKKYAIYRRFRCNFRLKEGYLPFIHIRSCKWYSPHDCLETSYVDKHSASETCREYIMTQVEFELFCEHYEIDDYEPLDYLTFTKAKGIFDIYIDTFAKMKIEATKEKNKAKRQIAKLYLNSLYGRLATSTNSSFRTLKFEDDVLKFIPHLENNKKPVAISAGAYITAYARNFTIRACQQNYFPGEDRGFMYADTDSAHMVDYEMSDVKGMKFSKTDFCCWDVEVSKCAVATYAKQKTYLEIATEESGEKVLDKDNNQTYNIICKAAGLSDMGKGSFIKALINRPEGDRAKPVYVNSFKRGLIIRQCNLKSRQIKGGVLLIKSDFVLS